MKRREVKEILGRLEGVQKKAASRPRPILLKYGDGHEERTFESTNPVNGIKNTAYIWLDSMTRFYSFFAGFSQREPIEKVVSITYLDTGEVNNIREAARDSANNPLTEEEIAEITREVKEKALQYELNRR